MKTTIFLLSSACLALSFAGFFMLVGVQLQPVAAQIIEYSLVLGFTGAFGLLSID